MGYTPLYDHTLTGTLYGRWPHTGIWACLLSRASREGVIDEVPASLAAAIGVDVETLLRCIQDFMQPDPGSRTKAHEGRRLELLDPNRSWGWWVLNHGKYREKARKQNYDQKRTESGADAERKQADRESREVPTSPAKSRAVPLSDSYKYKSTQHQIPKDFVLTPEREEVARKNGISNPSVEFTKFREYYEAKGTKWKKWDLVWSRWCKNNRGTQNAKKDPYANSI
jgi:hypothetical protein